MTRPGIDGACWCWLGATSHENAWERASGRVTVLQRLPENAAIYCLLMCCLAILPLTSSECQLESQLGCQSRCASREHPSKHVKVARSSWTPPRHTCTAWRAAQSGRPYTNFQTSRSRDEFVFPPSLVRLGLMEVIPPRSEGTCLIVLIAICGGGAAAGSTNSLTSDRNCRKQMERHAKAVNCFSYRL